MSIAAMRYARAMYQSYSMNSGRARLAGDLATAEHYAHIADHWFRVYRAEQARFKRRENQGPLPLPTLVHARTAREARALRFKERAS